MNRSSVSIRNKAFPDKISLYIIEIIFLYCGTYVLGGGLCGPEFQAPSKTSIMVNIRPLAPDRTFSDRYKIASIVPRT